MEMHEELSRKVEAYKPADAALDPIRSVPLLFAVGISGAGKDTVLKRLAALHRDSYQFMVSYTTRRPRVNQGVHERNGKEYHFIDMSTAMRMLDQGAFVEVNHYADNLYGVGIDEIVQAKQSGKMIIKDVDINGVINFVRLNMNVKPVFILPPSYEIWWERLVVRYGGTVDYTDLAKRMKTALNELSLALKHEYFYLVINDKVDLTVERIHAIAKGESDDPRPAHAINVIHEIVEAIHEKLKTLGQ